MSALPAIEVFHREDRSYDFRRIIAAERDALSDFLRAPDQPEIGEVIALLARQKQPIALIGIGKSGHIAAKIAATFSSLGSQAHFINAAEAAHGDLGAIARQSVVIMLSNSGGTDEMIRLVPSLRSKGCKVIAITGCGQAPLARVADYCILAKINEEADPLGLAPTSSTALQLAIGDALAIAVSRACGRTREEFLADHPAGLLGRQLIPVASIMRQGEDLPKVHLETSLLELLTIMSAKRMGAACVVDQEGFLLGLIVDGDVRRHVQAGKDISASRAKDIMQASPRVLSEEATLGDALHQRERTSAPWLVMPITDDRGQLKGMLHMQDVLG